MRLTKMSFVDLDNGEIIEIHDVPSPTVTRDEIVAAADLRTVKFNWCFAGFIGGMFFVALLVYFFGGK